MYTSEQFLDHIVEGYVFSDKNLLYKFEEWKSGKNKVLLVTGYSGSGKTALGKQIAEKYNAEYNELDTEVRVIAKFDELKDKLMEKYSEGDVEKKLHKLIHDYVIARLNRVNKQSVWEGCYMLTWLTPKEISKYSVVMMGTSIVKSALQAAKRRINSNKNYPKNRYPVIKDAYITTKFNINELMKYYNSLWKYLENINIDK